MPNISISLSGQNPNDPITEINCGTSSPRFGGDINISLFPELTGFYCTGNDIKSINISNNQKLRRLEIFDNQLTQLPSTLSGNQSLVYFDCSNNEISGNIPDIRFNSALQYFNCSGNDFTGFNGTIINSGLGQFYANNNKLYSNSVDSIINAINLNNRVGGILDLSNGNQPPSISSIKVIQSLGTNFTRVGNLVTANVSNHGYTTSNLPVTIEGLTPSSLNGTYRISIVNSNQFQYTTTIAGNATGAGTATLTSTSNPNDGFGKYQNLTLPVSQGGKGWDVKISPYFIKKLGESITLNDGIEFGFTVAINNIGNRIVVGDPFYNVLDGAVKVFEWDGENWNEIFNVPILEADGGQNGYSVAMNGVGNIIAFGSPTKFDGEVYRGSVEVYEESGGSWSKKGLSISGVIADSNFGSSVSLNSSGNVLAIGHPNTTNGSVSVFQFDTTNWTQLGATMNGSTANDLFGDSIALHPNENKIIIGAPAYNDIGMAELYEYKTNSWQSKKKFFQTEGNSFGNSVSICKSNRTSKDMVAIADVFNSPGIVYLYHEPSFGSTWTETKILPQFQDNAFGSSIELNNSGDHLVIGASDSYLNQLGQVRIYKETVNGNWGQIGIGAAGINMGERFGYSVSINSDGSRIVAGAPGINETKVYELLD